MFDENDTEQGVADDFFPFDYFYRDFHTYDSSESPLQNS